MILNFEKMRWSFSPCPSFLNRNTQRKKRQMEDTAAATQTSQADLFNVITYYVKSSQNRARWAFVFIKHIQFFFFKWLIVSLDKTLIHRLVSFIALWSSTETVTLTFNRLESIEVHYMVYTVYFQYKNPGMFSSKTFISFRLKTEIHKHLGWHGGE